MSVIKKQPTTYCGWYFMTHDQITFLSLPNQEQPEKSKKVCYSQRKIREASRHQIEMIVASLDEMIPDDHPVKAVWAYVDNLDLSKALIKIESYEGCPGRSAIDPKILVALWLYATAEGIGSARTLARYTREHVAFKWICGNVEIERRTISDFRVKHGDLFDDLLAQGIAILAHAEAISLKEIAHDGLRVKANTSKKSFHRKKTIQQSYQDAKDRLAILKKEIEEEPNKFSEREKATKQRVARERVEKLKAAQDSLNTMLEESDHNRKKHKKKVLSNEEKEEIRVSTVEPEARKMKMPDGSFHPAYNFQFAVDTSKTIIVGVDVIQTGTDGGQMLPMYTQIKKRYGITPERYLADGGFKSKTDVEEMAQDGCDVYVPLQEKANGKDVKEIHKARKSESKEIGEWRTRMAEEESKVIYKKRGATIELCNARLRKYGLYRLCVKGLEKAKNIAKMFAVTHNMMRSIAMGMAI